MGKIDGKKKSDETKTLTVDDEPFDGSEYHVPLPKDEYSEQHIQQLLKEAKEAFYGDKGLDGEPINSIPKDTTMGESVTPYSMDLTDETKLYIKKNIVPVLHHVMWTCLRRDQSHSLTDKIYNDKFVRQALEETNTLLNKLPLTWQQKEKVIGYINETLITETDLEAEAKKIILNILYPKV